MTVSPFLAGSGRVSLTLSPSTVTADGCTALPPTLTVKLSLAGGLAASSGSSNVTVNVVPASSTVGVPLTFGGVVSAGVTLPVPTLPALSLAPMMLSVGTLLAGMVKSPLASETMGLPLAPVMGLPALSVMAVLGSVLPLTELSSWRVAVTAGASVSTV